CVVALSVAPARSARGLAAARRARVRAVGVRAALAALTTVGGRGERDLAAVRLHGVAIGVPGVARDELALRRRAAALAVLVVASHAAAAAVLLVVGDVGF